MQANLTMLALLLAACTPVPLPDPPASDPGLVLTAISPDQCTDPVLLEGTAPVFAGTTATATVVADDLPSTFAVEVAPDGAFAIPKKALTVPVERLCPQDGACTLDLFFALEGPVDGAALQLTASVQAPLAEDRIERFPDADGDGFGSDLTALACEHTGGFVDIPRDCDDASAAAHPGHPRIHCDGLDNDCIGGEEHVKTLQLVAEGRSPAEQLRWALDHVDQDGQVILCDLEPFVGSFVVDGRPRAMGPLSGKAVLIPDGGPALTVRNGAIALSNLVVDGGSGTSDGCLAVQNSIVEMTASTIAGCTGGGIDVDPPSSFTWRRGTCAYHTTDGDGGCLNVRGSALLDEVELLDNHAAGGGGAIFVNGSLQWDRGGCTGNSARDGGCVAVGPTGYLGVGVPDGDPVRWTADNEATDRGNQAFVQGTLELVSATIDPSTGPASEDIAIEGGTKR